MKCIQIDELRRIFILADDGNLYWKERGHARQMDRPAGSVSCGNYRQVTVSRVVYQAHRIVFAMANGRWPAKHVDHINMDKYDNRPENLRECTHAENQRNRAGHGASGAKGVSWDPKRKKWVVYIALNKKHIFLGRHDDLELAAFIYECAAHKYHGEFARTTR